MTAGTARRGADGPERLAGQVERVVFHSQDSGFSVIRVKVRGEREPVTVVGVTAQISAGEEVEAVGNWRVDANYGRQFRAERIVSVPPTTEAGIERYLASGMVRGIGPHFAKVLVETFGAEIFDVIESAPDRLLTLRGIGPKRVERIVAGWEEQKKVREIMLFLHSHGIGTSRAVRIYRTYGAEAIALISENPYRLARDISGIGFKTADELAARLGIDPFSEIRARAGISWVLAKLADSGSCASPRSQLVREASAMLEIPDELVAAAIEAEIADGAVVPAELRGEECLYLASLYRAEAGVAASIARLMASGRPPWREVDAQAALAWLLSERRTELSASQSAALAEALCSKVLVITGGPGVGKTTLVNSILAVLEQRRIRIALCAPTGRAARRMQEATGRTAKTIHRLLEFDPAAFDFKHNRENPLPCDLLVADEASMIDVTLANRLLAAVPDKAAVILVGDVDQLPSVGPGRVLADLIDSGAVPTVRLTEVFRQARESLIVTNAHLINAGSMPRMHPRAQDSDFYLVSATTPEEIQQRLVRMVAERIPARFGFDPIAEVQVLTPMNRGGLGARALNDLLRERLNGSAKPSLSRYGTSFAPGDKVIQLVNNYQREVFNGDMGIVVEVDLEAGELSVDFDSRVVAYEAADLDELSLAYAISIHKSQGSEYPAVVIPLAMQHYAMLERRLLYTAVTRAKRLVVLIGENRAVAMAVKNVLVQDRLTGLKERLLSLGA
ncbi:MAG: ATP-dependent RecD-like DNA helicase [Actinomycetota bacterium]|nr:ATP-dependent RecD-like DNA helicase [Actinomycetota bacterium]